MERLATERTIAEKVTERSSTERAPVERLKSFEDLFVWQKSHELVLMIYKLTKKFPKEESTELKPLYRRVAIAVPANIANGYKVRDGADKLRYYNLAQAALEECRYYLVLSTDLGYINDKVSLSTRELLETVSRLLNSYGASLFGGNRSNR